MATHGHYQGGPDANPTTPLSPRETKPDSGSPREFMGVKGLNTGCGPFILPGAKSPVHLELSNNVGNRPGFPTSLSLLHVPSCHDFPYTCLLYTGSFWKADTCVRRYGVSLSLDNTLILPQPHTGEEVKELGQEEVQGWNQT